MRCRQNDLCGCGCNNINNIVYMLWAAGALAAILLRLTHAYSILRSSHTHNYWYFTINSRNRILVNAIYRPCCYGALENTFKLHCQFDLYLSINCKCFFLLRFFFFKNLSNQNARMCRQKMSIERLIFSIFPFVRYEIYGSSSRARGNKQKTCVFNYKKKN